MNIEKEFNAKDTDKIPEYRIVNIIASTDIGEKLDLALLGHSLANSEYYPEVYFALIYRVKKPKTSILINKSGKIIFVGAKKPKDIEASRRLLFNDLIQSGYHPKITDILIQNIVVSTKISKNIDLENLSLISSDNCRIKYNPKIFPGMSVKYSNPKFTATIFKSGKIIIVGLKNFADIRTAINLVFGLLT